MDFGTVSCFWISYHVGSINSLVLKWAIRKFFQTETLQYREFSLRQEVVYCVTMHSNSCSVLSGREDFMLV